MKSSNDQSVGGAKKPRRKKILFITIAVITVAAIGFGIWSSTSKKNEPTYVDTAVAEIGDLTQVLNTSGTLQPHDKVQQTAPAELSGATVSKVYVEVGDTVKKGERLAALDTANLAYSAQQARSACTQIEYANRDAIANANLLTAANAQLANTDTLISAQEALLANLRAQFALGEVSQDLVTAAEARLAELNVQRTAQQATVAAYTPFYLTQAVRLQLANSLSAAQHAAEQAEKALSMAQKGITAQAGGVITALSMQSGGMLVANSPVVVIASRAAVDVIVPLSRYDLQKVSVGQKAEVMANGVQYTAVVSKIDPAAQDSAMGVASSYINATVSLENPGEEIYFGLEATVAITTAERSQILLVPSSAVNTDKSGTYCFVYENGVAVRKAVEAGTFSDTQTEITAGLSAGEVVITTPQDLTSGQAVTNDPAKKTAGTAIVPMGMG